MRHLSLQLAAILRKATFTDREIMEISVALDVKKLQKGLKLSQKQVGYLHKRAAKTTARNMRTLISKDSMGVGPLRRKKVIKARVRDSVKGVGVWVGLNPISASEFRGAKQEEQGGVTFKGVFFKDAFRGRFKSDPKSVTRILRATGDRKLYEVLIPIEDDARRYLEGIIRPLIPELFDKNFEHAVSALPFFRDTKRAQFFRKSG